MAVKAYLPLVRVVAHKPLHLFPGVMVVARLSPIEESVMAHPPYGSTQKGRIRFALYCVAIILRRFLYQRASKVKSTGSGKGDAACGYLKP